jgi:tol-pal system protein YbgF|tara:strand:- start:1450 stop:2283 length:834 start_codon:yes stop_codon:yes gene_type:complete
VNKKIFILVFLYAVSFNSYAENSDVLMRMYERLEMIRVQMQQLTEENQQLNNKIISLQDQQDRLYQDLSKKIEVLNSNLEKNNINIGADSRADIQKKELIKKNHESTSLKDSVILKANEAIIPKDENELDLAKIYQNNNFKSKLVEYQLKNEVELYRSTFQLVKDKKYGDAIDGFSAFLYLFPQSNYASNAQYWLSESIYALGDYQGSMINFAKVVQKYPNSSKIADAKLKIGYCYYSIKKWKEARFIFKGILKDYPNTSLAQLAKKKIQSMDVEGR